MAGFETAASVLKPLLGERISGLGLKLEGSPMEPPTSTGSSSFVPRARRPSRTRARPAAGQP